MVYQARRSAYFHGPKGSFDSNDPVSDVSQTTDVTQSVSICTLPAMATTSNGTLGWSTKRRKHVSFVTPTSQDVHSIEPILDQEISSVSHL